MAQFTRTGITNLIRHKSGMYYLQAKIGGKKVRQSLNTRSKDLARFVLPSRIRDLRAKHEQVTSINASNPQTVLAYLERWRDQQRQRTDIEPSTLGNYMEVSKWIEKRWPDDASPEVLVASLWREIVVQYAPSPANNLLSILRALADQMVADGHLTANPFAGIKRQKANPATVDPLSLDQLQAVIDSIRGQGKAYSNEAADFVAVLAFSGLRVGQVRALTADDVGASHLRVRAGVLGSKGADTRMLPINRHLEPVLRRRVAAGLSPLFVMQSPRDALNGATERLGLPSQRVHDLRHFFATYCIEQGVDLPTVSRWLGHKDGGILVGKVYGHLRDTHSAAMARLL